MTCENEKYIFSHTGVMNFDPDFLTNKVEDLLVVYTIYYCFDTFGTESDI